MLYAAVALTTLILNIIAWISLSRYKGDLISSWFLVPLGGTIIWVSSWLLLFGLSQYFASLPADTVVSNLGFLENQTVIAEVAMRYLHVGLLVIVFGLLLSCLHYPRVVYHPQVNRLITGAVIGAFNVVVIPLIGNSVVAGVVLKDGLYTAVYTSLFGWYQLLIGVVFTGSVLVLLRRVPRISEEKERRIMLYFVGGFIISLVGIVITNLIYPIFQGVGNIPALGPIFSGVWIITLSIGLTQEGFLDGKMVVVQSLLGFLAFILLLIMINNTSVIAITFDAIVLICYLVLCLFLIRELEKESKYKSILRDTNQSLEKMVDVKDSFLRMTAHQLRAPLGVIQEYLALLIDNEGSSFHYDQIMKNDLVKMYTNTQRLQTVVDDISLANSISSGQEVLRMDTALDLQQVLEAAIVSREHSILERHIEVTIDTEVDQYQVAGDPIWLKQALIKILENALIFGKKQVQVQLDAATKYYYIRIQDDGIGLSKDERKNLYRRFYRSKRALTVHPDGSGLGLYLARHIIEAHGGTIKMTSPGVNQGTTCTIRLPKHT